MRKLIILEINEVPFKVYDDFINKHPESTIAKILNQSAQYETVTTDQGELHPWSTWPTLYRGVDNTQHKILDIGEDLTRRDADFPPVWQVLVGNKIETGVFASLHTYPLPKDLTGYKFLVPDPFANGDQVFPENIRPFQAFNLAMSRKSGRSVDKGIDKRKAIKLMLSLPNLGLRLKTIGKTINQLVSEKKESWKVSRRRSIQSLLAFDLFFKLLKRNKPQFTTFFSNHVASAMHRYWAAAYPSDYESNDLPKEWIDRYKGEVDHCMWQLDDMLKDMKKFVDNNPEYRMVIASSMGQAATQAKLINHELFLTDYSKLNQVLGDMKIEPVSAMHPQYNFKVEVEQVENVEEVLKDIKVNGKSLRFRRKEDTFFSIDLGYPNVKDFKIETRKGPVTLEEIGFEIKKIDDQSGGTAYHIPEGALFIYDPQESIAPERFQIDLREVAPSILKGFGIQPPSYMKEGKLKELTKN